jgi:SAM-dependent methyltransferase
VRPAERFSVLDVGAGSGATGAALRRAWPGCRVTSLDRRPLHLARAVAPRVAADAFRLPFPDRSFDFVLCSLFLHHFPDADAAGLLAQFRCLARCCAVVIDLERHPLAYYFLPATRRLLRWHAVTLHDGPISVEAGFYPAELEALARAAGAREFTVRRHHPWRRLSLVMHAA